MKKLLIAIAALLLLGLPGSAQILSVTGDYRVTNVDRSKQRFGIALRDDDPHHRENWVYVKGNTELVLRKFVGNGSFKDQVIPRSEFWAVLTPGRKLRVHGGRDWDQSIVAYKIWM